MRFSNLVRPPVNILRNDKFGLRNLGSGLHFHNGVDLRPQSDDILASHEGTVTFAGKDQYGGLFIDITNGNQKTRYLHNRQNLVSKGQKVDRGQLIGYIGNTGLVTGRHLHFETWVNGQRVDPISVIDFNSQPYSKPKPTPIPVTPVTPVTPVQPSQKIYTVKSGDSLWAIAQKELGSGIRWQEIYNLNKDKIKSPDLIYPDQKFILP